MTKSAIKAVVFDLDGTLYEDIHHFDFFAKKLEGYLPHEKKSLFINDYNLSLNDNHPLRVGRIYDVERDFVLVQKNNRIAEAYKWNGEQISNETVSRLYPDELSCDFQTLLNCGDIWWVLISLAAHYGLEGELSHEAFLKTREYMMSKEFEMVPIPGLKNLLETLQKNNIKNIVLTNSPEPDSEAILKKLNIDDLFTKKIFNGNKPISTTKWIEEIKAQFKIDYDEILSVGDNWINEISPVGRLGCKTIYLDAHEIGGETPANYIVTRLSEAFPIIKILANIK